MSELEAIQGQIEQEIRTALSRQLLTNRGAMQPSRLAAVARDLVAQVLSIDEVAPAGMEAGRSLNGQGLSLESLIEGQSAALKVVVANGLPPATAERVCGFFGWMFKGFAEAELIEADRQRKTMEQAFVVSLTQQREQELELRNAISELSTPIVPVYQGVLVLPLVGSIDSHRANDITERLLEALLAYQADTVIIDLTGVQVMDTETANHLLRAIRAAELLGTKVVLVGISGELAQTIVHIGIMLEKVATLANLEAGIAYALECQGLGIRAL